MASGGDGVRALTGSVEAREAAWPEVHRLRILVPDLGPALPGQYVLAGPLHSLQPLLLRPLLISGQAGAAAAAGIEALVSSGWGGSSPSEGLTDSRPLRIVGPLGKGFSADSRIRRALLAGSGAGLGPLLYLARSLVDRGVEVTFVGRPEPDGRSMPGTLLPPEVEYVLPPGAQGYEDGALLGAVDELLPWADQLFLALPQSLLPPLLDILRRRLLRLRKGFAQALVLPGLLPCGVGACDLCTLPTRDGYRRLCRDGLVFELLSLV